MVATRRKNGSFKQSEEQKRKHSEAIKGEKNHFFGKYHSKETRLKMSKDRKGRYVSKETRLKLSKASNGRKHTPETLKKMSKAMKGKNIGKRNFGNKSRTGQPHSEKTKRKMRLSAIGRNHDYQKGNKNHNWRGGKSFEPYTTDWTKTLKQSIRERDNFTCQMCGKLQGSRILSVHHIDYDKKNCDPKNLITLCVKCHTKTNYKRKYWINYFTKIYA